MEEQWYVFRAHQSNILKIKNILQQRGIVHFIPFHREISTSCKDGRKETDKPLALDYIFIWTSLESFEYRSFPYSIHLKYDSVSRMPMIVPERQMKDFMFLYEFSEHAMLLSNDNLKRGDRVRVLKGEFAGIEGELIRIKGHKRVVVRLDGLFSLAVDAYLPKSFLETINKNK